MPAVFFTSVRSAATFRFLVRDRASQFTSTFDWV
jgi:hypothetical protein